VKPLSTDEANALLNTLPIVSWKWPRPVLAVLMERSMSHASAVFPHFMQIAAQGIPTMKIDYQRTDVARNHAALEMLRTEDYTHLIMLDIDHIHPIDIVQRFSRWVMMDPEIKVIGGMNFKRSAPHTPCCFYIGDNGVATPAQWEQGLIEVDALGTGSIMIAREVFEQIKPPWFFNTYNERDCMMDVWPGEDMGFSQLCRENGIKMFVDTGATSPHMTDRAIDENDFRKAIEAGALQISEYHR